MKRMTMSGVALSALLLSSGLALVSASAAGVFVGGQDPGSAVSATGDFGAGAPAGVPQADGVIDQTAPYIANQVVAVGPATVSSGLDGAASADQSVGPGAVLAQGNQQAAASTGRADAAGE